MSEPYDIEGQQIVTGVSAGIALAPDDGESSDLLLKNADMALYQTKQDGRRIFRFFAPAARWNWICATRSQPVSSKSTISSRDP